MKQVKFGLGQITNQTPAFATNIFRAALYGAAIVTIVVQASPDFQQAVKEHILCYTALIPTIVHMLSKCFGVTEIPEPAQTDNEKAA